MNRADFKAEQDRRLAKALESTKAKLADKRRQRQEKTRKRDAGLRLRHAERMRRINDTAG